MLTLKIFLLEDSEKSEMCKEQDSCTHWTLMECNVEQKMSGACIAFEKRLACKFGREPRKWRGRSCGDRPAS